MHYTLLKEATFQQEMQQRHQPADNPEPLWQAFSENMIAYGNIIAYTGLVINTAAVCNKVCNTALMRNSAAAKTNKTD